LHPFEIQRNDAAFGKVDAPFLLIFDGNSVWLMAYQIENRGTRPVIASGSYMSAVEVKPGTIS